MTFYLKQTEDLDTYVIPVLTAAGVLTIENYLVEDNGFGTYEVSVPNWQEFVKSAFNLLYSCHSELLFASILFEV